MVIPGILGLTQRDIVLDKQQFCCRHLHDATILLFCQLAINLLKQIGVTSSAKMNTAPNSRQRLTQIKVRHCKTRTAAIKTQFMTSIPVTRSRFYYVLRFGTLPDERD